MKWKALGFLAIIFTIFHHGPMSFIYVLIASSCFFLGLLFSLDREMFPDFFQRHTCSASKGISSVTAIMDMEGVPKANIKLSNTQALDAVCNQIISYILRDYIYSWYGPLTPDTIFPTELHRLLQQITANLIKRISQVNWIPFLTQTLPSDLASHVRIYRTMLERQRAIGDKDKLKLFFDCEAEAEKSICREDICTSTESEFEYLRRVSEVFLFFILPCEEYRVPAIRYIARELLVSTVLVPTINLLSDPDFVNRSVAWFAKDSAFTSDNFIQALKLSDNTDELDVVIQQANGFTEVLRGRDTGGDDDIAIKAQLGSLDYVRKICFQRLDEIKEGVMDRPDALMYNIRPDTKLYDMSFKELMSTSVALVSFLDYLTSVDKHHILRLYLNCMSYRDSAQQLPDIERANEALSYQDLPLGEEVADELSELSPDKIIADTKESSSVSMEDNPDSNGTGDNRSPVDDTLVHPDEIPGSTSDTLDTEEFSDSSKPTSMVDDLRAFGVLLCGNLLKQLPTSVEPLVQQVLRTLTIPTIPPDPNAFAEVEAKLAEILSDPQCFGAFKKSSQYIQLLAEMDLLKDPSESIDSSSESPPAYEAFISSTSANVTQPSTQISPTDSSSSQYPRLLPIHSSSGLSAVDSFFNIFKQSTPDNELQGANQSRTSEHSSCSSPSSVTSFSLPSELYTAEIVRTEVMRDSYVAYTIRVTCTSTETGNVDTWQTLRRFSNFAELHSLITDRCGNIPKLKLPSKRAFSNMSRDFLQKRRRELNDYLAVLCSAEFLTTYPTIRSLVIEFLQSDIWERGRAQARVMTSILNPLRTMSNAMKAMPDTLADGFSRMFTGLQTPASFTASNTDKAYGRSASFDTGHATVLENLHSLKVEDAGGSSYSIDPAPIDDSPIGKLFLLVDEIFNLQQKNHLSREGNFVILRKIFHPLFGPRINKMIISKVREYTSGTQMAEFLAYLRDTVWPPTDPTKPPTQPQERSRDVKLRTRVLCRTMLLGSLSEELAQFLGNETTRRGAARVFRLLQEETLNRRFVHHLLQAIILHMFSPCRTQWQELFEKHLCPLRSGRTCRIHSTQPE